MNNAHPLKRLYNFIFDPLDKWLLVCLLIVYIMSLFLLYSADGQDLGQLNNKSLHTILGFTLIWGLAKAKPQFLANFAVPLYVIGVILLIGVEIPGLGVKVNGATRWLNLGITRIQPSEIMKIAVPMMLAWYFQKHDLTLNWRNFIVAIVLILIPCFLILKQPDLGTTLLIAASGIFILFFAGLSWKVIIASIISFILAIPVMWLYVMKDYQKIRVLTLIDPMQDRQGAGYHIIQSMIAIGSGGVWGKGWLNGTQTHLDYIPESTTDFIFAVYAEEFGLIGNILLLLVYLVILGRGFVIANRAPTLYGRLLSAALTMTLFCYAFVNMGMVSGILPVVGVPLPLVSYGGTATLSIMFIIGLLMGIANHRR
ncbi:rod shape-determining protein RodA [Neisseria sp. Ec49-e6-T10]|uniref:rod shape-determining protein RodA n=1 Tax=Neisseria sp. Ec49-e6-T10 TaxID=3140744 RepID=UPI003EBE8F01